MRFIGNKENLVDKIHHVMLSRKIKGSSIFDFFSGTTSVSKYFKKLGYQVYSSDLLFFSYVLQKAYIENNIEINFDKLLKKINFKNNSLFNDSFNQIIDYLNSLPLIEGFIYKNYTPTGTNELNKPRMYFSDINGKIIDTIRLQIEDWKMENLITENEYFVLLACLIETVPYFSNISGVYAAFQKKWDPRAIKKLKLKPIEIIINNKENKSYNENSLNLINQIKVDILYIDPPYNQRQYAPNYHLLETIAKYDNPEIKGISGLRNYENQKSNFCNAESAIKELYTIANTASYTTLILSYNSEGIIPKTKIISVLEKLGDLELIEFNYLRFKSNNNGESKIKKFINEQLYILRK